MANWLRKTFPEKRRYEQNTGPKMTSDFQMHSFVHETDQKLQSQNPSFESVQSVHGINQKMPFLIFCLHTDNTNQKTLFSILHLYLA